MERLTPEEAYVLNPAFKAKYVAKPDEDLTHLVEPAKEKVRRLIPLYDGTESFHVYYLCSLRSLDDFREAERKAKIIEDCMETAIPNFKMVHVGGLSVPKRYDGENDLSDAKGQFERKILAKCLSGFMDFGGTETWGKIVEAAMLRMFYNRPVVIYTDNEKLFNIIHDIHPLRIIGSPYQGLGFHSSKDFDQALDCLASELTNENVLKRIIKKMPRGHNEYCHICGAPLRLYRPCV